MTIKKTPKIVSILRKIGMYKCPHCNTFKPSFMFGNNRSRKYGKQSYCLSCTQTYIKDYRKSYDRSEEGRKYFQSHKTERQQYVEQNKEKVLLWKYHYKKSDKGKLSNMRYSARRRQRIEESIHDLSLKDWNNILQRQNNFCAGCGIEFNSKHKPQADHIFPVSLGGHTTKSNIQALCGKCNRSKGNKTNWTYPLVVSWT